MPRGIFGDVPLPSGARGYLLGEQTAQQNTNNQLSQFATLLGLQNSMQAMPLQRQLLETQVAQAKNPSPILKDLGGSIGVFDPRTFQKIGELPKTASPDAQLRETGAQTRHTTPSADAMTRAQSQIEKPYFTPVPTAGGVMSFNNRTGGLSPSLVGGKPVIPATADPQLKGDIAAATAGGKERGEAQAQAEINLPQSIAKAEQASSLIDQMVGSKDGKVKQHPGFQSFVGATLRPGARLIEGSPEAGFQALYDQVKGGAFLQAFESLKGGGQITEVEGRKATDAITRLNKAQSEEEFTKAAREFQDVIRAGVDRAKARANPQRRSTDKPNIEELLKKYGG